MGLALPIIDTQRRGIAFGPQWPCDSCDVGSRLQMVLTGVTLFVCHQPVDTLQDTLFGKCHRLRKDLTSCSAEACLNIFLALDETVKALAFAW